MPQEGNYKYDFNIFYKDFYPSYCINLVAEWAPWSKSKYL